MMGRALSPASTSAWRTQTFHATTIMHRCGACHSKTSCDHMIYKMIERFHTITMVNSWQELGFFNGDFAQRLQWPGPPERSTVIEIVSSSLPLHCRCPICR
jgi:hypothetical protein